MNGGGSLVTNTPKEFMLNAIPNLLMFYINYNNSFRTIVSITNVRGYASDGTVVKLSQLHQM